MDHSYKCESKSYKTSKGTHRGKPLHQLGRYTCIALAFGRLRQEDCELKASLGYTVRLKKKEERKKEEE
jgi:hypothetical protein